MKADIEGRLDAMPLHIRPLEAADEAAIRARFAGETRPPWMDLPHPYRLDTLLVPTDGLRLFVAETSRAPVAGLVGLDTSGPVPCLVGPLLPDEQLAELIGIALINHAVAWAAEHGHPALRVRVDIEEERGIGLFVAQGFHMLPARAFVLAAAPEALAPAPLPPGLRVGPGPDMVSSDYLRLIKDAGDVAGAAERMGWTRSEVFEHLKRSDVHLVVARNDVNFVGLAEFHETSEEEAELVYFGLVPAYQDAEIAQVFMQHAVAQLGPQYLIERVWLTIETEEPLQDLDLYLRAGFANVETQARLERPTGLEPPVVG